jgi:hypothetical protein
MTMLTPSGQLDVTTNTVFPVDTGQWDSVTTWDGFTSWYVNPTYPIVWYIPVQDQVFITSYNMKIVTETKGIVTYQVSTSSTGAFAGEETSVTINPNDTSVSGFTGRYFTVAVKVDRALGLTTLDSVTVTTTNAQINETLSNLDTSTLGGTITARPLPIARTYSLINSITIDPRQVTAYNVDMYVSNYATSTTVIPRVVSKNRTTPTIALLGIDGSNKDGTVDVTITGLPEQYRSGNNLLTR